MKYVKLFIKLDTHTHTQKKDDKNCGTICYGDKYPNCCTSCCFQLKNFYTIDFLNKTTLSATFWHVNARQCIAMYPMEPSTLGFGIISILSASASTILLIAFKFTHLYKCCKDLLNPWIFIYNLLGTSLTSCLCWRSWTFLLTWIHWPGLTEKSIHYQP